MTKKDRLPERFKLGGEYYWPGPGAKPVRRARMAFLQLAAEFEPDVVLDVIRSLYPLFRRHRRWFEKQNPKRMPKKVEKALAEWQNKWNLSEPWARYAAIMVPPTMHRFSRAKPPLNPPLRDWWGMVPMTDEKHVWQPRLQFHFDPIVLEDETVAEYVANVRDAFEQALIRYVDEATARAEAQGMKRVLPCGVPAARESKPTRRRRR